MLLAFKQNQNELGNQSGSWNSIPQELLVRVLASFSLTHENTPCKGLAAVRATCSSWRRAVDSNCCQLQPSRWPSQPGPGILSCSFPGLRALNLSHLPYGDSASECSGRCGSGIGCLPSPMSQPDAAGCCSECAAHRDKLPYSSSVDLGAVVLQPKLSEPSASLPADPDCVVSFRAGLAGTALTSYVASRWPDAVPQVAPYAALRIWRDLPQLQQLQALSISGSMLLVQSVRTLVEQCPDAAAGLSMLQHFGGDECGGSAGVTITHVYSLALPPAICQLTGLRSLAVEWRIPAQEAEDSSSNTSNSSTAAAALHGSSVMLPNRRRSYEGSPRPEVVLLADPQLQLPLQFSRLCNLQHLSLAASITDPGALMPLLGLSCLQDLSLGPGELDVCALLPLAGAGVLAQLRRLALKQLGAWDVRALAAVLAAMQQLQEWEVEELEMNRYTPDAVIPPEQRLTPADTAVLAASLTSLSWTTCSQRLGSGCSLLCRTPVASPTGPEAAGSWLGGCAALKHLSIAGVHGSTTTALSAPVLEVLSCSIGECSELEQLQIHGLGVPLLPAALAQLQQLHTVSIASTTMARRAVFTADAALAVLGSCRGLRSLTLAGCELRQVPAWLSGLVHLTQLQLNGNYVQELPSRSPCLGLPAGLQLLNLSDNRLRDVPHSIAGLSALQKLQLNGNYLSSLPQQVWQLPALQELSVRENMLPLLPELPSSSSSSGGNRSHRSSSSGNSSSTSSSDVQAMQAAAAAAGQQQHHAVTVAPDPLEDEELAGTGVLLRHASRSRSAAPSSSSSSSSATITGNSSSSLSTSLRVLVVADNQLCQLPSSITMLTSLQHLDLGHNQLRTLPDSGSIWALTRLTSLQLSHNHLKKLPSGMSRLQQLVALDVSGNHLHVANPARTATAAPQAAAAHSCNAQACAPRSPAAAGAGDGASSCSSSPCTVDVGGGCTSASSRRVSDAGSDASSSSSSSSQPLPSPLRALRQLRQLRMGGQHVEERRSSQCPLQLLLGGLSDLVELLRSLAPPGHQCPVTKAAAAAVAHLSRVSGGKRAKREREAQLLERLSVEPGWVVLPAPKASVAGPAEAAGAGVGGGVAVY